MTDELTTTQALARLEIAARDARLLVKSALLSLSEVALRQPIPEVLSTEVEMAFEAETALSRLIQRLEG